jgi:hypothetical protein
MSASTPLLCGPVQSRLTSWWHQRSSTLVKEQEYSSPGSQNVCPAPNHVKAPGAQGAGWPCRGLAMSQPLSGTRHCSAGGKGHISHPYTELALLTQAHVSCGI